MLAYRYPFQCNSVWLLPYLFSRNNNIKKKCLRHYFQLVLPYSFFIFFPTPHIFLSSTIPVEGNGKINTSLPELWRERRWRYLSLEYLLKDQLLKNAYSMCLLFIVVLWKD